MEEEEEEEAALARYCRAMVARVRLKQQQQQLQSSGDEASRKNNHGGGGGRTGSERGVGAGGRGESNLPLPGCTGRERRRQSSPGLVCQGPEVRPVPLRLVSMLRLKTFKEEARRAAEVELHDPAVCGECAQERAHLALRSFIWRKKTQLHTQTLKGRLNTHTHSAPRSERGWHQLNELVQNLPKSEAPLAGFWGGEQLGEDMRVTATWGCLSNR